MFALITDSIFTSAWPTTSDLGASELQNLTLQQEHEIFLKKLILKNWHWTSVFLYLELMAKSIGNDFFGLIKDEKSNVRNNAIIRAAAECVSVLKLQNRAVEAITSSIKDGAEHAVSTGDIIQGFIKVCSRIDEKLYFEILYNKKRDEYMKQNMSIPKRTYQYSFEKPTDDQRKIIAELYNDNQVKKFLLHTLWISIKSPKTHKSEEAKTKFSILELIKVPSKSEAVQRIYEQSIEETAPLIRNFTYNEILRKVNSDPIVVAEYGAAETFDYEVLMTKLMVSKINNRPDLVAVFKAIGKLYETSIVEQTTDEVIIQSGHRVFR